MENRLAFHVVSLLTLKTVGEKEIQLKNRRCKMKAGDLGCDFLWRSVFLVFFFFFESMPNN